MKDIVNLLPIPVEAVFLLEIEFLVVLEFLLELEVFPLEAEVFHQVQAVVAFPLVVVEAFRQLLQKFRLASLQVEEECLCPFLVVEEEVVDPLLHLQVLEGYFHLEVVEEEYFQLFDQEDFKFKAETRAQAHHLIPALLACLRTFLQAKSLISIQI